MNQSDNNNPSPFPPYYPAPQQRSSLVGCLLAISLVMNVLLGGFAFLACLGAAAVGGGTATDFSSSTQLSEIHHSGSTTSKDKVAIINLEGVIMEGALGFVHKQIAQASKDKNVKAVVLRVNSPGGSITASDDLHRRLVELKQGNDAKKLHAMPHLVVSMGSLAASGGYYVAMPASKIFAERTTMTGSIGVYASFPNMEGLSKQIGAGMITIKQGEIKDSGSPFKEMGAKERQVWQDMVDQSYNLFIKIVEDGRPELKNKFLEKITIDPLQAGPGPKIEGKTYTRYRADGGIFTGDQALKYGLIDQIGTLEDAVAEARKLAGLSEDNKAIRYEKPRSFMDLVLEVRSGKNSPKASFNFANLPDALMPRLWYLAPGSELSGISSILANP